VRILTLNDDANILKMAQGVVKKANSHGLRADLDSSNETVAKKIAEAEKMKIPYTIVLGPKELESNEVKPRTRSDLEEHMPMDVEAFLKKLSQDAKERK
jgi:threonyl-tRNA synthetase